MGIIINPNTGEEAIPSSSLRIEESTPAAKAELPMSHFVTKSNLDGCYILKDGRMCLRVALLDNADEKLIGWTFLDAVLVERIIKRSMKYIKLSKRKANVLPR